MWAPGVPSANSLPLPEIVAPTPAAKKTVAPGAMRRVAPEPMVRVLVTRYGLADCAQKLLPESVPPSVVVVPVSYQMSMLVRPISKPLAPRAWIRMRLMPGSRATLLLAQVPCQAVQAEAEL